MCCTTASFNATFQKSMCVYIIYVLFFFFCMLVILAEHFLKVFIGDFQDFPRNLSPHTITNKTIGEKALTMIKKIVFSINVNKSTKKVVFSRRNNTVIAYMCKYKC